jgi:hypothetical protein
MPSRLLVATVTAALAIAPLALAAPTQAAPTAAPTATPTATPHAAASSWTPGPSSTRAR